MLTLDSIAETVRVRYQARLSANSSTQSPQATSPSVPGSTSAPYWTKSLVAKIPEAVAPSANRVRKYTP